MAGRTDGRTWVDGVRPYVERGPLAAFALGVSSGFPYSMIAATLTSFVGRNAAEKSGRYGTTITPPTPKPPAASRASARRSTE